jgi:ADP-heptose:LPS heptosyltransferase
MISNDTGPMHAAAAMGKPLVALFGPTNPNRTGPFGQLQNVAQTKLWCAPCTSPRCHNPKHLECLRVLAPSLVLERLQEHLASLPVEA